MTRPFLPSISQAQRRLCRSGLQLYRLKNTHNILPPASTATGIRYKSSWYRRPSQPWSIPTQWHTSTCKWVRSDGDPRTTPRDLDCSACQAEEASMHEMSARELQWEKHMQDVKEWIEDNPYRALFGNSEERLRGVMVKDWENHWYPVPGRLNRTRDYASVMGEMGGGRVIDIGADATSRSSPTQIESSPDRTRDTVTPKSPAPATPATPVMNATGYWSTYTNDNGNVTEASGKLRYDPITMRLVPDDATTKIADAASSEGAWPKKVPIVQESTTLSTGTPSNPAPVAKSEDAFLLKEKLEKSFVETRKSMRTRSEEIDKTPPTKTASDDMGAAWRKEQNASSQPTSTSPPEDTTSLDGVTAQTKSSLESAWTAEKQNSTAASSNDNPHYLGQSKPLLSHEAQMASMSLKKKDKPLRHMRGYELGQHKASLLAAWSKKGGDVKVDKTQEQLDAEIQKQKTAFVSHEDKWRLRNENPSASPTSHAVFKPVVTGTGAIETQDKTADNNLVRDVREIYEDAYGVIDAKHVQGSIQTPAAPAPASTSPQPEVATSATGHLDDALSEYDRKMGASGYAYHPGQDNLEEEMKHRCVSDSLKPSSEQPNSRKYSFADIIKGKSSTTTKTTLLPPPPPVNPIDGTTRPRTFAEYMDLQTFSPTGYSSPAPYEFLTQAQAAAEPEVEVKVSDAANEVAENATKVDEAISTPSPTSSFTAAPPPPSQSATTTSPSWTATEHSLLRTLHSKGVSTHDLAALRRLRRWSASEHALLHRLHNSGLTVRDIASLPSNPTHWTREATNQLVLDLAQWDPSKYQAAAEDVEALKGMVDRGLSGADVAALKRLSKWTAGEVEVIGRLGMGDLMRLDREVLASREASGNANGTGSGSRIVRKQEAVFSGSPVNSNSSTFDPSTPTPSPTTNSTTTTADGPRLISAKRRRRAAIKSANESNFSPSSKNEESDANVNTAGRYPSSFLHSTRTYMPVGSLFDSDNQGNGGASTGSNNEGDSSRRGGKGAGRRRAKRVLGIVAAVYATGWGIEWVRSDRSSPSPSSSSSSSPTSSTSSPPPPPPTSPSPPSTTSSDPSPVRSSRLGNQAENAGSTKKARTREDASASPTSSSTGNVTKVKSKGEGKGEGEEDSYIEAAKADLGFTASAGLPLSRHESSSPVAAATTTQTPAIVAGTITATGMAGAAAPARGGNVGKTVAPVTTSAAKARANERVGGEKGYEGLAVMGAGIVTAALVLFGGFGGSG